MRIMLQNFNLVVSVFRKDPVLRKSFRRNALALFKTIIRNSALATNHGTVIINLTEHIGDIVACEPVSYHIRKQHPKSHIVWSVNKKYAELVKYNPHIDEVLEVTCLTEWISLKRIFLPFVKIYDLHINGKRCTTYKISNKNATSPSLTFSNYLDYGNLLQVAAIAGGIRDMPDYAPKFHFKPGASSPFKETDYLVIHPLSNEIEKNWCNEKWNQLVVSLLQRFPDIHVVEIGLKNIIKSDDPRYHDFTGRLDFQQIGCLIRSCSLFIGVDSGFGHFANALRKNSIILMGHYQHFRNYSVYSGDFARSENLTVLYHEGTLKHLEIEKVEQAIESRLVFVYAQPQVES
jgi:heptosyltransferase III